MIFKNRKEAGQRLAQALPPLDPENTVVIALPRGGVPVAAEICRARGLPLDLVFVRKIGTPGHAELALGAIVDGPDPLVEVNHPLARNLGIGEKEVAEMGRALLPEIARRRSAYLGDKAQPALSGKTLVVVDDGVATGATLRASLRALRARKPKRLIVALPIGPEDSLQELRALADEVICLETPARFYAVGQGYRDFSQTSDAEVMRLIDDLARPTPDQNG
ncbi:phosphoribosyltransferase [Aestuariicoccus sp. MJ-SS9]|uniref:phosphoribosyltransferase n=1 Tax=Aestuariicoccus sp. MJ-SS9 TaxID=3079855 RepID=UPI002911C142|nr:phosphoribosyltransferase [Aestuariicoccus sp. MJ-SS9]MDU8911637.1 phosphoribosyltransferase [Aestuariicoccus sp. MJ-SS9]